MWPGSRKDQFSRAALFAIFDYLEEYEDDCETELEYDPIAICCDFTEYGDANEAASEYFEFEGMTYDEEHGGELETPEEVEAKALEFLRYRTTVIEFDGGIVIQNF
jgi:hypothetical protein